MATFKVISSKPSNEGKSFVTKLSSETTQETVFGTKTKKETYYVSGTKQMTVDTEITLNLNDWRIAEYPFDNPETGEHMMLKWLHLK